MAYTRDLFAVPPRSPGAPEPEPDDRSRFATHFFPNREAFMTYVRACDAERHAFEIARVVRMSHRERVDFFERITLCRHSVAVERLRRDAWAAIKSQRTPAEAEPA